MSDEGMLNVRDFGAVGDGSADDTAAIQKAIDAAAETRGTVCVPPGVFRTARLKMHSHTGLVGRPTWSYRDFGGSILRLADPAAACLLDLTGAVGVTVNGLCLDGGHARDARRDGGFTGSACGVLFDKPDYGRQEDNPRIERCRIGNFAGDGIRLGRIWCWSVRHCMVCFNGGHGIYVRGWDGFLLDTWLSGNVGAGYATDAENASTTLTANRIEWNQRGGIVLGASENYNITGNYLDRAGGCALRIKPGGSRPNNNIAVTGNVIYRSGRPDWRALDEHESSHAWIEETSGLVVTGNTFRVWRDDGPVGHFSPRFGIVYRGLTDSVIAHNVLSAGALDKLLVDLNEHGENVVVADNPGSLFVPPAE